MGIKLSELQEETPITLIIRKNDSSIEIGATIQKIIRYDTVVITLDFPPGKRLVFDSVKVDMEYRQEEDVPIIWRNVSIVYYKSQYVLQTREEGRRHNRRACYRLPVSKVAQLRMAGRGSDKVMIRDISLSGFSISDRKFELNFKKGERIPVYFEDRGFALNLVGDVVRIEEREDMIIYGLRITNICKDLSPYISMKQRQKKG